MFMNNDKQKKKIFLILFTIVLLCFSVIFSVRFGSVNYSTSEIFKGIFVKNYDDEILKAILWDIRIPRILIAVMVGCNLSLAGVLLQAVMKNPLADSPLRRMEAEKTCCHFSVERDRKKRDFMETAFI